MGKKIGLYLPVFVLLIFINFYLAVMVVKQEQRKALGLKVLNEIEEFKDPLAKVDTAVMPYDDAMLNTNVVTGDARSKNLKHFFRKYNSPLYDYADYIVMISDKYKFDYRLLPAIAMQESNLCRFVPSDSHNCWGWGIYGDLTTRFDSYEEAIDTVAVGIRNNYINEGLVTPSSIMSKYTPSSNGSWARGVNNVLGWLE